MKLPWPVPVGHLFGLFKVDRVGRGPPDDHHLCVVMTAVDWSAQESR